MFWMIAFVFGIFLLLLIMGVLWRMKRTALPKNFIHATEQHWALMLKLDDPQRQVIEAEKILDAVLTRRGWKGSFGDKLKEHGNLLKNVQAVWAAHKLRNRIAHEMGMRVSPAEAQSAVKAFEHALRIFLH